MKQESSMLNLQAISSTIQHLYKINQAIHFSAGFLTSKIVFKFLGFFSLGIHLSSALVGI